MCFVAKLLYINNLWVIALKNVFLPDQQYQMLCQKYLTPNIVRPTHGPTMADQSTWLYGTPGWLRHKYIFCISTQEIINVESIKIMATKFCFSPKMIPTLPNLLTLLAHQCQQRSLVL